MSQITVVSSLPFGRRIAEIMDEKGAAFSQRAFAPRVGFSKDTLGRVIAGERNIKPSELRRIAEGLSISLDRLQQQDVVGATRELLNKIERGKDLNNALQLANQLHAVAVGITEKLDSKVNIARVYYKMGDSNQAHHMFLQAYQEAEKIYEKYKDDDRLYNVLSKLMVTFAIRKQFSQLAELLGRVDTVFHTNAARQGAIYFSKAMLAEQSGNVVLEGECLYNALECYRMTGDKSDIGRAEHNRGHFEFKHGNYGEAKRYLEHAIHNLEGDPYRFVSIKDYARILIKLEEREHAAQLLEQSMVHLKENLLLREKYMILLTVAKQDTSYIETILSESVIL